MRFAGSRFGRTAPQVRRVRARIEAVEKLIHSTSWGARGNTTREEARLGSPLARRGFGERSEHGHPHAVVAFERELERARGVVGGARVDEGASRCAK